jgi:hypothetical protein
MQGKYKKFSNSLYNENDSPARAAVIDYISSAGLMVKDNPDKYGPDLIVHKGLGTKSHYVEVEVKRVWSSDSDEFPWATVQIPARKKKFLDVGLPIEFFILRSDLRMAIVIPDFVLGASPLVEVKNKYIPAGEMFYQVDISQCDLVDISTDSSKP